MAILYGRVWLRYKKTTFLMENEKYILKPLLDRFVDSISLDGSTRYLKGPVPANNQL